MEKQQWKNSVPYSLSDRLPSWASARAEPPKPKVVTIVIFVMGDTRHHAYLTSYLFAGSAARLASLRLRAFQS